LISRRHGVLASKRCLKVSLSIPLLPSIRVFYVFQRRDFGVLVPIHLVRGLISIRDLEGENQDNPDTKNETALIKLRADEAMILFNGVLSRLISSDTGSGQRARIGSGQRSGQ
jgi:hypothetical protein